MSYAMAVAVQTAIFQALRDDADLAALVGAAIYDELPKGALPSIYVTLGPETVEDRSDVTGAGSLHRLTLSVVSDAAGFAQAKTVGGVISDVLARPMALDRGQMVYLNFERAVAQRSGSAGKRRRVDLRFRARVDDV